MNLVSFALRRPITILVLVIAVMMTGFLAIERMPRDVFPDLGVPVLYVAQPYGGMDPAQMEGFIVNYYEYHFLYITGIEHVESEVDPGRRADQAPVPSRHRHGAGAWRRRSRYVNRARAFMPTGTVPPFVMRFDAGSVPVGDLVFSGRERKAGRQGPAGRGALPGAAAVRDAAGRVGAAAVWRQPANHRHQRRSRPAARLQHEPGRGRRRRSRRATRSARPATCASAT